MPEPLPRKALAPGLSYSLCITFCLSVTLPSVGKPHFQGKPIRFVDKCSSRPPRGDSCSSGASGFLSGLLARCAPSRCRHHTSHPSHWGFMVIQRLLCKRSYACTHNPFNRNFVGAQTWKEMYFPTQYKYIYIYISLV